LSFSSPSCNNSRRKPAIAYALYNRGQSPRSFLFFFLLAVLAVSLVAPLANAQPDDSKELEELRAFLENTIGDADSFEDKYDAEVWLVDMSARLEKYVDDPQQRLEILRQIHYAARKTELPPELVLAVIEVESHFNRFAISRVGAQGMMQVMPFWKNEIGRPEDNLTKNITNFEYGCRILQFYINREDGKLFPALARYNGSYPRRVYSNKVYDAWLYNWRTNNLDWSD
jgi:soluble lytic murein transglycosylase-like protein